MKKTLLLLVILLLQVAHGQDQMLAFSINQWPSNLLPLRTQDDWAQAVQAQLLIYSIDSQDPSYCPEQSSSAKLLYQGQDFKLRNSGNRTKGTAKASIKINLAKKQKFLGRKTFNLKSMWNDPSMIREALVWDLFEQAQVVAPRQTYAKLCVNGQYLGLFALIEQVDEDFLQDRLGKDQAKGNLYKAYWGEKDLGPATLSYRGDQGSDYFIHPEMDERTYQLKTNEEDTFLNTYDDLANLIRIVHSKNQKAIEEVFDVKSFLRWAAVNQLVGAWDNYLRTGANYYLYNKSTDPLHPKFVWIPWDYDNSFGISYQESDIAMDWKSWPIDKWTLDVSARYQRPLIETLLEFPDYKKYYIDFFKDFTRRHASKQVMAKKIDRLYQHINKAVYQESDCPLCRPYTGRQFSNHIFYLHTVLDQEVRHNNSKVEGIRHFSTVREQTVLNFQ
jgi:hypothetical protein